MKLALNLALAFCTIVTFAGFLGSTFGLEFLPSLIGGAFIAGFVAPQI